MRGQLRRKLLDFEAFSKKSDETAVEKNGSEKLD